MRGKKIAVLGIIALVVLLGAIGPMSDKQVILFFHLEGDQASLTKVKLREAPYKPPRGGYAGTYKLKVYGIEYGGCIPHRKLVYEKKFFDPTLMFWDEADPETGRIVDGGQIHQDPADFMEVIPYMPGARWVHLYRQEVDTQQEPPETYNKLLGIITLPPEDQWEVVEYKGVKK